MILRNIQQIATVILKYFFDFDFSHLHNALPLLFVAAGLIKLLFYRVGSELADGIDTVKQDALIIKNEVSALARKLNENENSRMPATLGFIKERFTQKPLW